MQRGFVPFVVIWGRDVKVHRPPFWYSVGPLHYGDYHLYGYPLLLWGTAIEIWFDFEGHNLGGVKHGFACLLLPLVNWGEFRYRDAVPKPLLASYFAPLLLPGVMPARWFFDGNEGRYWHVLWGTIGHIQTPSSSTLILGFIPVKYRRCPTAR